MDKKIKNYQNTLEAFLKEEMKDKEIPGIEFQLIVFVHNKLKIGRAHV